VYEKRASFNPQSLSGEGCLGGTAAPALKKRGGDLYAWSPGLKNKEEGSAGPIKGGIVARGSKVNGKCPPMRAYTGWLQVLTVKSIAVLLEEDRTGRHVVAII